MEPCDVIRYRLLNYLIEAHESQLISANVAILNEIAEADWAQVRQALNDMFLAGDIALSKDSQPYRVEVNAGWGDTLVVIVGLPDAAVKESRDRVSTALTNSGFKFPMGRTTTRDLGQQRLENLPSGGSDFSGVVVLTFLTTAPTKHGTCSDD